MSCGDLSCLMWIYLSLGLTVAIQMTTETSNMEGKKFILRISFWRLQRLMWIIRKQAVASADPQLGHYDVSNMCCVLQVIDLLNDLYTTFDSIIDTFDVYKVCSYLCILVINFFYIINNIHLTYL